MSRDGVDVLLRLAIDQRRLIQFTYQGASRIAEPHDYGIAQNRIRILAFQVRGRSNGPLPGWRMFDIDRIGQLVVLDETFPGSRGRPEQSHKRWDELFCRVS